MIFKDPNTGFVVASPVPWLWSLLFGPLYFAYKECWNHAAISLLLAILSVGLAWIIYPFFAKKIIRSHFLEKGWVELDS